MASAPHGALIWFESMKGQDLAEESLSLSGAQMLSGMFSLLLPLIYGVG